MSDKPNCWQCRFFKVSWDPRFPYACDAMGFKSRALPCVQVERVDGRECQSFSLKPPSEARSPKTAQAKH